MEQLIINALKSVCGNRNIKFQVIIKDNLLHIYANHRQDYHPQYVTLEENVCAAIASLGLEAIDSVWLYGRPLGQTEPNWQVFVELPTQVINKREEDTKGGDIDPLDNLPDLESLTDAKEGSEFKPNIQDSREDIEALSEVWHQEDTESISEALRAEFDVTEFIDFSDATSNSIGDTGLLQNTGFVHGSPLKQAEINTLSPNFSFDRVAENSTPEVNSQAQYCFITNRKLLTEQTCDPTRDTMRMVKFFHHLSEADRQQLLPILDSYFRESITPGLETTIPAIQNWVEKIKELGEEDRHLLAVWLSRYCFNPEVTLEEFEQISAANAAESNSKNSKKESTTEYSFVSIDRNSFSDSTIDNLELDKPKFQLPPIVKKLLLPGVWILTTVILIILSIFNHNSNTIATSARIPALCRDTIGSPEYCRLAVNLAGEKALAQAPTSLFPLTKVTESVATYGCGRYANLKAGIEISKIPPATTPVISTYGEKVFPHIYVTQVEQKHAQKSGNIKVGCVYTTGKGQRSPKKLAADTIPFNWPTEHYQQTGQENKVSFGIYAKPIKLGLYTIFAALAIAIASRLNLALKINQTHTIYLVALLLGIVQLCMSLLPAFGLLLAIIVPMAIIPLLSFLLKDFQLNWKRGYDSVAISILTIVAIQLVFYSLSLGLISGLM